jgi:hypothetical protein
MRIRTLVLASFLILPLTLQGGNRALAARAFHTNTTLASYARLCGHGFHCQDVHVQLCIKRPSGRNIWAISRKDAKLRRGVSTRGCTEYAVGIGFTLRYNGRQAAVQKYSQTCIVQAQQTVQVAIRKCYSTVQRSQKRFRDLIAGARVCVRDKGYHGPGCHDDFAVNVYAYANGRLMGQTFVGFPLRVSNL